MEREKSSVIGSLRLSREAKTTAEFQEKKASCFVLVHGAWFGGWCWNKLTPLLRADGHNVHTPTLTGLGDRAHLLTADINLDTHVRDILSFIEFEDLENVILVGHSYGGMVVTGVSELISYRLSSVVYLDAFLPENGKALVDYVPPAPAKEYTEDAWRVKPIADAGGFGVINTKDVQWVNSRLRDQPIKTIVQPVQTTGKDSALRKTFIQCSETPWFSESADRAKKWNFNCYQLLGSGHMAMITSPKDLAQLLLKETLFGVVE